LVKTPTTGEMVGENTNHREESHNKIKFSAKN